MSVSSDVSWWTKWNWSAWEMLHKMCSDCLWIWTSRVWHFVISWSCWNCLRTDRFRRIRNQAFLWPCAGLGSASMFLLCRVGRGVCVPSEVTVGMQKLHVRRRYSSIEKGHGFLQKFSHSGKVPSQNNARIITDHVPPTSQTVDRLNHLK